MSAKLVCIEHLRFKLYRFTNGTDAKHWEAKLAALDPILVRISGRRYHVIVKLP